MGKTSTLVGKNIAQKVIKNLSKKEAAQFVAVDYQLKNVNPKHIEIEHLDNGVIITYNKPHWWFGQKIYHTRINLDLFEQVFQQLFFNPN